MYPRIKVFAGNASRNLAERICKLLSIEPGQALVGRFADGEVQVQIQEHIRDEDVFLINSTNPPAENIIELLLLVDAARGASAGRITIVVPYMGYNRKDRKDDSRVPVSARVIMMDLFAKCGTDRALLIDLHQEATAGFFEHIKHDHLYSSYIGVPYLKRLLTRGDFVVAAPDSGATKRAWAYADLLGSKNFVVFYKPRTSPGEVDEEGIKIIGDVRGKNIVFVDDMIDTGGTLVASARVARQNGAGEICAFATHGLFSRNAIARLDACEEITEVIVTDTIYHEPEKLATKRVKITVLSADQLLAQAIRRLHEGDSLSPLIRSVPASP